MTQTASAVWVMQNSNIIMTNISQVHCMPLAGVHIKKYAKCSI